MHLFENFFNKTKPICWELANRFLMLSDGSITTCCVDACGENTYGNLQETTVEDCVNSKKYRKLTKDLYSSAFCEACKHVNKTPSKQQKSAYKNSLKSGFLGAQIEVTASCNYACTGCPSNYIHTTREPMPDLGKVFETIKNILPKLKYLNCYNYGEPFLNPKLTDFLQKCRDTNPNLRIGISTNGMLLTKEKAEKIVDAKVDWVLFSLHGAPNTENLLKYAHRGADYETVLNNIKQLKEIRDKKKTTLPHISMRAILFNWNDTDELMDQFRQDAAKIGIVNANNGDPNQDNYHWILDAASPSERSSQRFLSGTADLNWLQSRKELGRTEKN